MDLNGLYESIALIKPEIVISLTLLAIVLFDLILSNSKKLLPFIAATGLAVTLVIQIIELSTTGYAFSPQNATLFYGMLSVDSFGAFFKVIILVSSLLIVYFSAVTDEIKQSFDRLGEYYTLIFGMILGMMFMTSAIDLILIYLSIELLSLSSYVLAGFTKIRQRNNEASLKYIIYGAVSSGMMLFGISLIYGMAGSTNLVELNNFIQSGSINLVTFSIALILIFAGFGFKISVAPFHFWTPDVYEGAPISITAFLSVASKAAGFAVLIRFIRVGFVSYVDSDGFWRLSEVFDWQALLVIISILTMTLGNFSALWQDNLKRMLAYSSIAHAGYMLLGLAVLSNQGAFAILVYFTFYLIMNIGAFFVVMLIANKLGSENIDDYNGLGLKSPFLGVALGLFLVSLTGLPPTAGFIGKLYLFIALVDAKMIIVAVIALLNTVVSLYYYIRVLKKMYLSNPTEDTPEIKTSAMNTIFILILAVPTLVFGLYFAPVVDFAKMCISFFGV
ncbi:MAG: NADH-quinone oxidoreductase subunit N [Bacteroidetes bacterium]|nr:NADH-quinone oxidoreductase subunit N [Bacteroidota bacterium]